MERTDNVQDSGDRTRKLEADRLEVLRTAIFQALGQASMCWERIGRAGEFDSRQAVKVGDALTADILELFGYDSV